MAFDLAAIPEKQHQECELFLGRFQPPHSGHLKIIKTMHTPVVALVKGAQSSEDKKKNPLSAEYQQKLLKKIAPMAKIIIVPTGYIPEIAAGLRNDGLEVTAVHCGSDRVKSYSVMVDKANQQLPPDKKFSITMKEMPRDSSAISATKVRLAIKSGNKEEFEKSVPRELWSEFNHLRELLKESFLYDFEEWLLDE